MEEPRLPATLAGQAGWVGLQCDAKRRLRAAPDDRSAKPPPTTEQTSSGPSWARPSSPTASEEWVWWNTWNGRAAVVTMLPMKDTAWPIHNLRKSRDTLNGVVSTRSLTDRN